MGERKEGLQVTSRELLCLRSKTLLVLEVYFVLFHDLAPSYSGPALTLLDVLVQRAIVGMFFYKLDICDCT